MLMIASILISLALIGVASMVMAQTVAPALPRMLVALNGASPLSPLPAWQRRPQVATARVRFTQPALRAAA
ncbi:hypothetical protein SPAN111604_05830 [Sphingomonas antarctica]|uniref:hypothetical protein n=1 Tax=Sphingomonas antarctica TaxID=2040274 RepID=UPI0039EB8038